jgi:hypothetical protein
MEEDSCSNVIPSPTDRMQPPSDDNCGTTQRVAARIARAPRSRRFVNNA